MNNFFNIAPQNEFEIFLENLLLDSLGGEFSSVKRLVELFDISKSTWYDILEQGRLISFNIDTRKIVLTRSLLPFLREAMRDKF